MTATITEPAQNGLIFAEVPSEVEVAILDLLTALHQHTRAMKIPLGPSMTFAELRHFAEAEFQAWRHAERVIEEAQGGHRLDGLYPVEGRLVGFAKRSKRGFQLHNFAAAWSINHPKSKGARR